MAITRHIVALGGGGFSEEPDNLQLDEYVLALAGKSKPRVCFLPTASGDAEPYVRKFHWIFKKLTRGGQSHLTLVNAANKDPVEHLAKQDVIYVGGGNTLTMLKTWTETGVDRLLREAYARGAVLAGISAGAHCWFETGLSDGIPGRLTPFAGLGLVPGSLCVHYDSEAMRRPTYQKLVASGQMAPGHGVADGAALHFEGGRLRAVVSSRPDARAYRVEAPGGIVRETELHPEYLGGSGVVLRRASLVDALGIGQAHHASVTKINVKDYSPEQIEAWTKRIGDPDSLGQTRQKILGELVWVAELDGKIEGFAHMRTPLELAPAAYLHALYLTPSATGRGLGRRLVNLAELEARRRGHPRMQLHASKTAVGFYAALGYLQAGPPQLHDVQGIGLECLPMSKDLPPL